MSMSFNNLYFIIIKIMYYRIHITHTRQNVKEILRSDKIIYFK